jgi:signal transduction histidine kinase
MSDTAAKAAAPSGPCSTEELRTLFLFEKLTDEQLDWLCREGRIEVFEPGPVYAEGHPATCFYVLIEGAVVLYRRVGGDDVEMSRTDQRGVYAGAWRAYLGDQVPQVYVNSMKVTVRSRFFVLDAPKLAEMMREWFPMALHMLEGLFFGMQSARQTIGQRERLLALGALSAGLTHELNNPAAAAVRATSSLRERVAGMRGKLRAIASGAHDRTALESLVKLQEEAADRVAKAPELSPLDASDREDAISDWLDDHGIQGGWELAPNFVQGGVDLDWLDKVAATVDEGYLEGAVRWLNYTIETELLMNEIEDSTTRISTLVAAAKQYSSVDSVGFKLVDVHDLLNSTLVMLGRKIGDGITVVKDYDRTLPKIRVHPSELNQVWTNLIDNAVSAMGGHGTLTVRTAADADRLLVEIGDTGPGVPEDIRDRIFEPFFTTKEVGEGTGLGLDISWRVVVNRHHGDLRLESRPGDTRFRVWLPFATEEQPITAPAP